MLGQTIGGRYRIVKHLGGGGFGQTYLAEDAHIPEDNLCVVKQLKPQATDPTTLQIARRLFDSEARVLNKLGSHAQIPRLLAHFEDSQEFYLVQEFVEGHDLSQEISVGRVVHELEVIKFLWELLDILSFVHQNQAIHRDLKPSNIMRRDRDGSLVLIDFGAVKQISTQFINTRGQTLLSVAIGTPGYAPNELFSGKPHWSSDIYSVGMMAIQSLTGLFPLELRDDPKTGELVWRDRATVSQELGDIIDRMVRFDYRQRYHTTVEAMQDLRPLVAGTQPTAPPLPLPPTQLPPTPPPVASAASQPIAPTAVSAVPSTIAEIPPATLNSQPSTLPLATPVAQFPIQPPEEQPDPGSVSTVSPISGAAIASQPLPSQPAANPPTTVVGNGSASAPPTIASIPTANQPASTVISSSSAPLTQGSPPTPPSTVAVGRTLPPDPVPPVLQRTFLQSSSSSPKKWLLGLGSTAVAAVSLLVGWNYFNQQQVSAAVEELKTLRTSGQHEQCISKANGLPKQAEVQTILSDCQLGKAKKLAQGQKLKDAIATAALIPAQHSGYAEAQKLIVQWSEKILSLADGQYKTGKLEGAIALAQAIPASSPAAAKAKTQIANWQKDWKTNQAYVAAAQKALKERKWQVALDAADKLPDTPFWQGQVKSVITTAQAEINKANAAARPASSGGSIQPAIASPASDTTYYEQPAAAEPYYAPAPEPYYAPAPEPYYPPEPAAQPAAPLSVPLDDSSACGGGAC